MKKKKVTAEDIYNENNPPQWERRLFMRLYIYLTVVVVLIVGLLIYAIFNCKGGI